MATLTFTLLVGLMATFAAGGTHDAAVDHAQARLDAARERVAALTQYLDAAASSYEQAQAHHLRISHELIEVERNLRQAETSQANAEAALRQRINAAYRAPHTELALATAVLAAPDAATAIHRADLISRMTTSGVRGVNNMRAAQQRAAQALRQRRIIAAGAEGAAAVQKVQADRLVVALRDAAQEAITAERELRLANARAARANVMRPASIGPISIDGRVCPVAGPNGFIDSWGFPRSGGRSHQGVDMFAVRGTPLVAVADGVVRRVWVNRLGGLSVDLLDATGDRFYYAHLDSVTVQDGQRVRAGEQVGTVGDSGNARGTPPHLHWQYHPDDGAPINPYPLAHALCR